ncbi:MAG: nucleoside deaminase [Clostridia bacterium]|nr:nucleoside deaminase [Clostridia bacterium]
MDKFDFMRYALALAEKSAEEGEVPVGAIVVCDGKIVGEGRNRRETVKNALHHAEIEAINDACKNLGGWRLWHCDMYVTLEPCPMCAGAIINSRIKNVYFGAKDEKNGAVISAAQLFDMNFTHKPLYEGGIMGEECAEILSSFFKKLRIQKAGEEK